MTVDGETIELSTPAARGARAAARAGWAGLSHADLDAGRGPARRGRRRAAPHLPRRRRARPQPRAGSRRLDPGRSRRRGRGRGRRRRGRGDEDGDIADRAVPRPRQGGAGRRERPRGGTGAARRARSAGSEAEDGRRGARVVRAARRIGRSRPKRCRENLRRLQWLVLGYDIEPREVERSSPTCTGKCADMLACDPALLPGEHRLLQMFADLCAVSRSPPRRGRSRVTAAAEPARAPARVAALPRRRRRGASRRSSSSGCGARSRTTGLRAWSARPRSRKRATACSCPGSGPRRHARRSSRSSTGASSRPSSSSDVTSVRATTSARRSTGW